MPGGTIKKLTFGPAVICYHLGDRLGLHKMFVNGKTEDINGCIEVKFHQFLCVSFGSVRLRSINFLLVDISWRSLLFPAWLSRLIHPTWDNVDDEMAAWNFGQYLKTIAKNNEQELQIKKM